MTELRNVKVAILATDGFEQSELLEPRKQLSEAGAEVTVIAPEYGSIKGWDGGDWGASVQVDLKLCEADPGSFDVLVLPGGQINPDLLRANANAVTFVREFSATAKPLAAICHAPWLLIEAGVVEGRRVTSYKSIRTDVLNAGGIWEDSAVVVDGGLITSRSPEDLDAFCDETIEAVRTRCAQPPG